MNRQLTPEQLAAIPSELATGARAIVTRLRAAGHEALYAGGVVRDLLLGHPVSDVDIATSARPEQVEELFPKTYSVGRQFGVVVVLMGATNFEVATFRTDAGYLDGRHPSAVRFTNPEEDARRRDFTANALFLDPDVGCVIDYVGGLGDLERRLIRTVGRPAERLQEDKLRLLRAIRFACQLGFEIDRETFAEVRRAAPGLAQVSWERIRDELLKIFTGRAPARGLELLALSDLLPVVLPEVAALRGVSQPPEFHPEGDVFEHTRLMFEKAGRVADSNLALAILLHDIGKPPTFTVRERIRFDGHDQLGAEMAETVCRRLRLSNEETAEIVELVRDHLRFIPVQEMRESTLKRFLRRANILKHLELHRLDCLASHGNLGSYEFCLRKLEEFSQEAMRPAPLIGGDDLIALGLTPGPLFADILERVEDLQLEGELKTREEAIRWVIEHHVC